MTDHILIDRPEAFPGVFVIRLNRPEKKNAITSDMYRKMVMALHEAGHDSSIRAVVFLGSEGCFSAGNDMGDFLTYAMSGTKEPPAAVDFLKVLASFGKPLVSGVDGLAIGIGTTLHLHCDLTVASTRSQFRTPFTDLALVPEAASSLLVPRIMGHQRAFAMLAAGKPFSAEQAQAAGLIWDVVESQQLEAETLALAASIAAKPVNAVRIARNLVRGDAEEVLTRIDAEMVHFEAQLRSQEARAAFEAFMKR